MVTRYEFIAGNEDSIGEMSEHPQGEFVTYDDYEELAGKLEQLKELIYQLYREAD